MQDELFMEMCLNEAARAFEEEEVPVGALIVAKDQRVIARAHNLTIRRHSPLAHAELLAIAQAAEVLGNHRLTGCTLFVSKEPCLMCAGAIQEARIKRVVFGCFDTKRGAFGGGWTPTPFPRTTRSRSGAASSGRKAKACSKSSFSYGGIPKWS